MNTKNSVYEISPENYKEAFHSEEDVSIQFKQFSSESEAAVVKLTRRFLEYHDQLYIKETVMTVLRELVNNSVKANIKRLYFDMNKLDINNLSEYKKGMDNFKKDIYQSGNKKYFRSLIESEFFVKIVFSSMKDCLKISILNNSSILEAELEKINSRILKAYKYEDISEAFEDILDDSEGAGLGLVMITMLLKNSGLNSDSLKIDRIDELTRAVISIPRKNLRNESSFKITDEIMNEIRSIPAFPDNIREIKALCSEPDASLKDISEKIARDPGLSASVIKLANSSGIHAGTSSGKINSIESAVNKVSIKGVETLILACGVQEIIESRYKKFQKTWENSEKMAFYAQKIANIYGCKELTDFAYLSALLADIGQIILYSLKPSFLKKLIEISGYKGLENINLLEEIGLGMSHSELGSLIFQKWEFDEIFVNSIKYHHRPHLAPEKLKPLVNIVYIADAMVEIENIKSKFEVIDDDVLSFFNLIVKSDFEKLHRELLESYSANI